MSEYTRLLEQIQKDLKELDRLAGEEEIKNRRVLAERVKFYRLKHGLTLEDLAKKMYVSKMAVIRWEKAEVSPSGSTLARFKELGIIEKG